MADENNKFRRVDVGFKAGPVLSMRLREEDYGGLRQALGGSERWHELDTEDSTVAIDLSEVLYVRLDTERGRVGF